METYIQELFRAPSSTEWMRFVEMLLAILGTIGIGEMVRHLFRWPAEFTRKLVHISVALLVFFAPTLFVSALPGLILGTAFALLALVSIKFGLLMSLHSVSRGAYGTVYYPIAFVTLIVLFWNGHPQVVSLSMLVLGFGDASAAIVGESVKRPLHFRLTSDRKSVQGSVTMFLVSALTLIAGLSYFSQTAFSGPQLVGVVLCAALIATACEALSSRALDNLTVPLSVGFVLYYALVPTPMQDVSRLEAGVFLGMCIVLVAYYAKFLRPSGAAATFLLASLVYGVGGWKWTVPILTFFVLSSLLSKWGKVRKENIELLTQKGGTRDAGQVAANGGIAGILIATQYLFQSFDLYPAYLATVAAVTADTWGTEIGTYVRGKTFSITTFRKVSPGVSGGISLAGLLGGVFGATAVAASAIPWAGNSHPLYIAVVAGVLGSLVDSLVGGTIQGHYRCGVCGKETERRIHCSNATELIRGLPWMNNDAVNWGCALSGAMVAFLLA